MKLGATEPASGGREGTVASWSQALDIEWVLSSLVASMMVEILGASSCAAADLRLLEVQDHERARILELTS